MRTGRLGLARLLAAWALVAALALGTTPARAGGIVGDGTRDSCTEAALDAALAGGGAISFDCGPAPHTILISGQKSIGVDTTIDGGGLITLDGQDAHRLFDVGASLTLRGIVLARAFFNGDGGAIRNNSNGRLTLERSTVRDSRATLSGGAILSTGPLTITDSLLEGNQALNGGALYPRFAGARTTIVGSVLRNNRATGTTDGWGGAILAWDGAPVAIEGGEIFSNTARMGGGIYNFAGSTLALRGSALLRGNRARDSGGGLWNEGTATLAGVTLSGNSAPYGGGIWNNGAVTLAGVTLSGNAAPPLGPVSAGGGGGLMNNRTATLTDVTISGNSASWDGGGLANNDTATLTNVTISGNTAGERGGGLANAVGTATLTNVTISGNTAGISGSSTYRLSGTIALRNTIVASSLPGGNCDGGVTDGGYNLATDTSCGIASVPDILLGPLADNGGPTQTHLPLPGSPAIDVVAAGRPPPDADQRGIPRPSGPACDAGAAEYQATLSLYLPAVQR